MSNGASSAAISGHGLNSLMERWLGLAEHREQRRFFEAHPGLLDPQNDGILEDLMAQATEQVKEARRLREALLLLQDARQRGGTVEAMREATVNIHGGFVLDIPSWLEEVEQQLAEIERGGRPEQTAEARVALLEDALTRAKDQADIAPETCSALQCELAVALFDQRRANRSTQGFEAALLACEEALRVFTLIHYPYQYAQAQHLRGKVFNERIAGEQRENLEQAIACFHKALRVFTLETFPYEYAQTQSGLGIAYWYSIAGERRENLEQAIACFHKALRVFTLETFPYEYAQTQSGLGVAYWDRIAGERRENMEQAIACFHESLRVRTLETFPYEYAKTQNNLGLAYWERIAGERRENLEQAIACYYEALRVRTMRAFPFEHAQTQSNLGIAYWDRIAGERRENLERAIACYHEALRVHTLEAFPFEYALTQHNLGDAFRKRLAGEQHENLEQAIACFHETLRVWTLEALPYDYALNQDRLGCAYRERSTGKRQENLQRAIACFHEALRVYTLDGFPRDYRDVQLHVAETEALRGNWSAAHEAYSAAREAEDLLLVLGSGTSGRDAILREGRDAATQDGYALARLGQFETAAVMIERGRARGLAEAIAFDAADPARIDDSDLRARYITARQSLITAQAELNAPLPADLDEHARRGLDLARTGVYREAKASFDGIVAEIRVAHDPTDFLYASLESVTILQAAERIGPGHALVYLAATPWGGMAVAALSANPALHTSSRFAALDLSALTETFVDGLLETRPDEHSSRVSGGFACTQTGTTFELMQGWPGNTFRKQANALNAACTAQQRGMFDEAAQELLSFAALTHLLDRPLDTLNEAEKTSLAGTLNHAVLQRELARCLPALAEAALQPLVDWLQEQGTTSLTIIPCGQLAAFPLAAVVLADGRTVAEIMPTSMAANARSLLREEASPRPRIGVYAVGDPRPSHQALAWSEAEAFSLTSLGRQLGQITGVKVQWEATRDWLLEALHSGRVVDASCHGTFNARDVLRSALLLANEEQLTLGDMLSYTADLRGLRLLILSACQTALLDLHGARDEVRSLAAGMLQAGAQAVLAAHWAVDDQATYLLMVRFAQEWLPRLDEEPPAPALARAQNWLRSVTNRELESWKATTLPATLPASWQAPNSAGEEAGTPLARGLVAVRGRGTRYDLVSAQEWLQEKASEQEPEACPYADPYYWAAFQILGW